MLDSLQALAIKEDIGYPPYIKDPKLLAAEYSGVSKILNRFFLHFYLLSHGRRKQLQVHFTKRGGGVVVNELKKAEEGFEGITFSFTRSER